MSDLQKNILHIYEKVAFFIGFICSISVVILATLQVTNVWDKAINVLEPIAGVMLVCQAIQQWRTKKTIAILSLCVAIFIFIVAAIVLLF